MFLTSTIVLFCQNHQEISIWHAFFQLGNFGSVQFHFNTSRRDCVFCAPRVLQFCTVFRESWGYLWVYHIPDNRNTKKLGMDFNKWRKPRPITNTARIQLKLSILSFNVISDGPNGRYINKNKRNHCSLNRTGWRQQFFQHVRVAMNCSDERMKGCGSTTGTVATSPRQLHRDV